MKATHEQYEQAVRRYDIGGPSAVYRYAAEIGVDSNSYCVPCETDTPDCDDDCCLVCGDYKPNHRKTHMKDTLICEVLEQVKRDIEVGDHTAIFELLATCPVADLIAFLPEEKWDKFTALQPNK